VQDDEVLSVDASARNLRLFPSFFGQLMDELDVFPQCQQPVGAQWLITNLGRRD